MDLGRTEFGNLQSRTNKVWAWSADSVSFLFPYGYDFAAGFDEVYIKLSEIDIQTLHKNMDFLKR